MELKKDEIFRNKITAELVSIQWHLREYLKDGKDLAFGLSDVLEQIRDLSELVTTDYDIDIFDKRDEM